MRGVHALLMRTAAGLLCLFLTMTAVSAETRLLDKDTKLHPQGWSVGEFIEFKSNTSVTLNEWGEVVTGTLDKDAFLTPRGWNRIINDYYFVTAFSDMRPWFYRYNLPMIDKKYDIAIPGYGHVLYKGGTIVTFDGQGNVLSGTLKEKATIRLIEGSYGFITAKGGTVLTFYPSGAVLSAVLEEDTHLRPMGWKHHFTGSDTAGFIKFSKGKTVTFAESGEVLSGTVKEQTVLPVESGASTAFAGGSAVYFDSAGNASAEQPKTE